MAGRLESMLQPGEQLVYQARLGISGFLRRWLSATAFIAALDLSLRWLTVEVPPDPFGLVLTLFPLFFS